MKKCNKCGIEKELTEFSKKRENKLRAVCKKCCNISKKEYNLKNKDKVRETGKIYIYIYIYIYRAKFAKVVQDYKINKKCLFCPENFPQCLEFHHLRDKKGAVSEIVNKRWSINAINEEIDKCVLLCANCHRKITFGALKISEIDLGFLTNTQLYNVIGDYSI